MRLRRRLLDRRWRGRSHRRAACALVQGGWWTGGRRAWSAADPAMWSIAEYCDHVREVLFGMRFMLDVAVVDPGTDLGPAPKPRFDPVSRAVDVTEALAGISHGAGELVSRLTALDRPVWTSTVTDDGMASDLHWIARHPVHDATHHLGDIAARILARRGRRRATRGERPGRSRGRSRPLGGHSPSQPAVPSPWAGAEGWAGQAPASPRSAAPPSPSNDEPGMTASWRGSRSARCSSALGTASPVVAVRSTSSAPSAASIRQPVVTAGPGTSWG